MIEELRGEKREVMGSIEKREEVEDRGERGPGVW